VYVPFAQEGHIKQDNNMRDSLAGLSKFVYVPRKPAEEELAVLIERINEKGKAQEEYHTGGFELLVAPRTFPHLFNSRDTVYKKD
ncbi:MAG: hypothetical protein AABY01_04160, partial [Nanoarchaeota archaeon]